MNYLIIVKGRPLGFPKSFFWHFFQMLYIKGCLLLQNRELVNVLSKFQNNIPFQYIYYDILCKFLFQCLIHCCFSSRWVLNRKDLIVIFRMSGLLIWSIVVGLRSILNIKRKAIVFRLEGCVHGQKMKRWIRWTCWRTET